MKKFPSLEKFYTHAVTDVTDKYQVQWGESSPAKHGGAYFSAVVGPRILAITGEAIEKPHALHNSLGIHLAVLVQGDQEQLYFIISLGQALKNTKMAKPNHFC